MPDTIVLTLAKASSSNFSSINSYTLSFICPQTSCFGDGHNKRTRNDTTPPTSGIKFKAKPSEFLKISITSEPEKSG